MEKKTIDLILGTMTFGESVFAPEVSSFLNTFLSAGYTQLDTAYVYNNGDSERLLGDALKKEDLPYTIATKVNPRITGRLDGEAVDLQFPESLRRLDIPSVDVLYLHFPDPATPVSSALEACQKYYEQGQFRELGLSNFPAWMVADVCHLCEKNGWVKPTIFQGIYNPLTRKAETELNACLDHFGMRFYAFNPLAGGLLSGRYSGFDGPKTDGRFTHRPNYQGRYWKRSYFEAIEIISDSLAKYDISIVDAVYRWLSFHSMLNAERGDAILIGASKLHHLEQNIQALKQGPLPEEVTAAFEKAWQVSKPDSPEYFTLYKRS